MYYSTIVSMQGENEVGKLTEAYLQQEDLLSHLRARMDGGNAW